MGRPKISIEDSVRDRGCDLTGCLTCPYSVAEWEVDEEGCMVDWGHRGLEAAVKLSAAIGSREASTIKEYIEEKQERTIHGGWMYPEYVVIVLAESLAALIDELEQEWLTQGSTIRPDKAQTLKKKVPDMVEAFLDENGEKHDSILEAYNPMVLASHLFSKAAELVRGIEVGAFT